MKNPFDTHMEARWNPFGFNKSFRGGTLTESWCGDFVICVARVEIAVDLFIATSKTKMWKND